MKILYGVQTTGNGHIVRSELLVRELIQSGHTLDILFSGSNPSAALFGNLKPDAQYAGLTFDYCEGRLNFFKTLFGLQLSQSIRDMRQLDTRGYDLVISDFEPLTAWAAKRHKTFSLGIANQYGLGGRAPMPRGAYLSRAILKQFAPVKLALGLHWYPYANHILPPVIDVEALQPTAENFAGCLAYLPFESLSAVVTLLRSFDDTAFVVFHPEIQQPGQVANLTLEPLSRANFSQHLRSCEGVISNAGFALPSEALYLGKKLLVKPLRQQFEQSANAMALEKLGLASVMKTLNHRAVRAWLKQKKPTPQQYPNVAKAIAAWISQETWDDLPALQQALWAEMAIRRMQPMP